MSLELLTKADTTDLIELAEVKARLGITASTYDTVLGYIIDDVSSAVDIYLGRALARQQYQESLRGRSRERIFLSAIPVDEDTVSVVESGTTLTAGTDFTFEDHQAGGIYNAGGWNDDADEDVVTTYYGGYLMPGVVGTWTASTAYALGAWVKPTSPSLSPRLMICTTAGTTDSTEPTWPAAGSTVTDNAAVWTAHYAWELPADLKRLAYAAVKHQFESRDHVGGLVESRFEGLSERYSEGSSV
ncbi:hypothetical protein DRQ32_06245, partial [bacterium]